MSDTPQTATQVSESIQQIRPFEVISHNFVEMLRQMPADKREEFLTEIYRIGLRANYLQQHLRWGYPLEDAIEVSGILLRRIPG